MTKCTLDSIFSIYSPLLFGIALKLSSSQKDAEKILINTFKTFYQTSLIEQKNPSTIVILTKLLINTANRELISQGSKNDVNIIELENTSLLQNLIFGKEILESHCPQNRQQRMAVAKTIRKSIMSVRIKNGLHPLKGMGST